MNERIKELAKQARYDSRNEKHYFERIHNRELTIDEYQEIYDEKLANAIAQECAQVGFNAAYPDKGIEVLTAIIEYFKDDV